MTDTRPSTEETVAASNAQVIAWFANHADHGHETDRREPIDAWGVRRACDEADAHDGACYTCGGCGLPMVSL